jgi:mono/diheme cytochrome c family protein
VRIREHIGQDVGPLAGVASAVVFALALAGCSSGGGEARPTTGKGIYEAHCATCHGVDGQGGVGPSLAGVVVDKYPDIEDEIVVVTEGRGNMPSWRGDLTTKEIRTVVEYTRTGLGQ